MREASLQREVDAVLRTDFCSFVQRVAATVAPGETFMPNWYVEAMAHQLSLLVKGEVTRLVVNLPPRHLKSIIASVALPAWLLGRDPTSRIICVSYAQDLTIKFANDFRAVVRSAWYQRLFPHMRVDPLKNTESELVTTRRGYRLGTSIGGTLTGRGAQWILIDDPIKPQDALSDSKREAVRQWFDTTLYSRLDDKRRGAIVLVMQRVHVDDLAGHLLVQGGFEHLTLPAIADAPAVIPLGHHRVHHRRADEVLHPARESRATLAEIKARIGSIPFAAQYQQDPVPLEGGLIRWSWFATDHETVVSEPGDLIVQSWDTASKAEQIHDYSVCTTWLRRGMDHDLLHVWRDRLDYPILKRKVVAMAEARQADSVLIEDMGSGTQLIQDLREDGALRPIAVLPEGDKVTRLFTRSAMIEAGHVFLPAAAPWLEAFRLEILQFPRGRYDDQIDSLSQYLAWRSAYSTVDFTQATFDRSPFAIEWERMYGRQQRPWDPYDEEEEDDQRV